jgi:predicted DNA-binding protein with PD1-like motif
MIAQGKPGRVFMGRLTHGADLLKELTAFAAAQGIRAARVEAIGAVQRARTGFYDQAAKQYGYHTFDRPMEILALVGNVSVKAEAPGAPFVHAHVTLADEQGRAFGGHLAEGTVIFAGEFCMAELPGAELVRRPDQVTGLALWGC